MERVLSGNEYDQDVALANQWWHSIKNMCDGDNFNNIMDARYEKLKDCNITTIEVMSAIEHHNKDSIHSILEELFVEPIQERHVEKFMEVMDSWEKVSKFLRYRREHLGMRFMSVIKAITL